MEAKKIGENIKELRTDKGYTQKNLADYLHISEQSISKWERGEAYPDTPHLKKWNEESYPLFAENNWLDLINFWENKTSKYTRSYECKVCYINALGYYITLGSPEYSEEERKKKRKEFNEIYLQILNECGDESIKASASIIMRMVSSCEVADNKLNFSKENMRSANEMFNIMICGGKNGNEKERN